MPNGMRKLKPTQDELNILNYWYFLRINAKWQDSRTGFYLSNNKTHSGLYLVNGENIIVKSEAFQIELRDFPVELWKFAESAPGSRITPASRAEIQFIKTNNLVRTGGKDPFAPPKGIRFGGYRSNEDCATIVKAWMDNPTLFIDAVMKGTGGAKYYR